MTDEQIAQISATSMAAALTNALTGAKQRCADLNAALTTDYLTQFKSFSDNVTSGRVPNTNPPQPPKAFIVGYMPDPTTGPGSPWYPTVIQWPYATPGNDPVCAMPPIPGVVTHATGVMLIGTQNPWAPEWFNAMEGDQTPIGTVAPGTSSDGVSGLFQKCGAPVGAGYFRKIG